MGDPPGHPALADLIPAIQDLHIRRRTFMIAAGDMDRRIKARERWVAVERLLRHGLPLPAARKFPKVTAEDAAIVARDYAAFYAAAATLRAEQAAIEKRILPLVRALPVFPWAKAVKGLGDLSLGVIVGEAGDIGSYANPGKLWKRMGLAVVDGRAQRRVKDAAQAKVQGYSPLRRAQMFVIGDCLIKAGGDFKAVYDARKADREANRPDWTKAHRHNDAKRYMEKRLLRELWKAWRAASARLEPFMPGPPANPSAGHSSRDPQPADAGGGGSERAAA